MSKPKPYETCDRDCLHCTYPEFPHGCATLPQTQWERQVLIDAHRDSYMGPREGRLQKYKYRKEQACIGVVRKAHGMTQRRLAAALGISKSSISHWECGMDAANWDLLCTALPELEQYRPKGR